MYITMKFIRKRIGEQVAYIDNLLHYNNQVHPARRADLIESAQTVQKRFEHYKDLCKGKLGIEIEDIPFEPKTKEELLGEWVHRTELDQSGRFSSKFRGLQQIEKEIKEVLDICFGRSFPLSQTFNPKPPSHIK